MPRVTYRTRLTDILAKDWLSPSDRRFAQSLLDHYNRKKYMSSGRARCVRNLEARYESRPDVDEATLTDLKALRARISDGSSWDAGFMDSVIGQVQSGRALSEKQEQTVAKVTLRYNDAALAAIADFDSEYRNSMVMQARWHMMVEYYRANGYYSNLTAKAVEGFIPTKKQYDAITANKYATKIITGWEAEAKYPTGSMAMIRSTGARANAAWRAAGNGKLPVVIVAVNAERPTSACKGNKVYKVLPVGCAQTFMVEERDLKKHRAAKKKGKK